jgi:hypothetical protein
VPNLIDITQKITQHLVEGAVCVRYYAYAFHYFK